jgi:asparagine synthase (glutamine-hydrolysing)
VGYEYNVYNEADYAKSLADKINIGNTSRIITADDYFEKFPHVQYHMDEPLADPAAVALYFASREAVKHVGVALSGEGADEFFGGYNIYREPLSLRLLTMLPLPLRKALGWLAQLLPQGMKGRSFFIRGSKRVEERYIGGANVFSFRERVLLLKTNPGVEPTELTQPYYKKAAHLDDSTKMQYLDIHLWLAGDILLKADKMSMAHSLDLRSPYLDREVFRVASRIPTCHRVNRKGTKVAFRQAAGRHLHPDIADRRKLGFPVPIKIWLKEEKYYNKVKKYFTGRVSERYFDGEALMALLKEHRSGKRDNSRKIWTVFMFLIWHEQFFENAV